MTNDLIHIIDSVMVNIPAGEVVLRDDRIKRMASSNSTISSIKVCSNSRIILCYYE